MKKNSLNIKKGEDGVFDEILSKLFEKKSFERFFMDFSTSTSLKHYGFQ